MKKNLRPFLFLTLIALFSHPAHADITIALVAPFTGSAATFGEQLGHGATQAIDDINARGGVLGQKIILKSFDDACDPKQAVAVANQIASQNIKFVIGHFCSGPAMAAEKVFMENEILVMSPAVGHPAFTEDADTFIFRVSLRADLQAQRSAQYIAQHFAGKKIAILNDKSAYGVLFASVVKQTLNQAGVQETLYDSFVAGERDYAPLITRLKQNKIDVVVIGGYHTEAGLIAKQIREQKLPAVIVGGSALITNEFWAITGKSGEGVLMVFGPDPRRRAAAKDAVASLRKAGHEPEGFTIYAYAAAQAVAEGIGAAHEANPRRVAAALRQGTYPTVIGDLHFDAKGDVQKPEMVMYQWHDGTYVPLKP